MHGWTADFALATPTLFDFLLNSPDSSSGTIDYSNDVLMSFTVYKRAGTGATFDVDQVFEIQNVAVPSGTEIINLKTNGVYDGTIEPNASWPTVPAQPTPYTYGGNTYTVNADGTAELHLI